jgi:hypothetical protein
MEYLISESQLKLILSESNGNGNITEDLKQMFESVKQMLITNANVWGLNAKFLITWGAALGGMILPLKNWLEGQSTDLTQEQIYLLLLGIAANYYYDNSDFIRKVVAKIKDEGLMDIFKRLYSKSEDLKRALEEFLRTIKISTSTNASILSYAFILPILHDIYQLYDGVNPNESLKMIISRIIASGVVLIGGSILTTFIQKVISKLSGD